MEFELFVERIADMVRENLPEGWENATVSIVTVDKVNITRTGLGFNHEEKTVTPTIYMEEFYERYKYGMPLEDMITEIQNILMRPIEKEMTSVSKEWLEDNNDQIVFQLINTKENEEYLKDIPHRDFHDLSVVYNWYISCAGGNGTVLVDNRMCEMFGFSEKDLYEMALKNTKELLPVVIRTLEKEVKDICMKVMGELPKKDVGEWGAKAYSISNAEKLHGAVAMLYPESFEELAEEVGDDLYILPFCRDGVIAIPKSEITLERVLDLLEENNSMQGDVEELLSHNIYQYDRGAREVTMASNVPHRSFKVSCEPVEDKKPERELTKEGKTR